MQVSDNSGFNEHFYASPDGLRLYARVYGEDNTGLPVICLPGLTRNSRDFHDFAQLLANHGQRPRRVICLDYRGRGRSDRDPDTSQYNLVVEAGDVMAACEAFSVERAQFVGTSRGGLTLHLLAQMKPELLAAVVLNDIGPVLGIEGLRHIQAYLAEARQPADWRQAVMMLRETHGAAFPALDAEDWEDMAQAIYIERDGRLIADFDPAIAQQFGSMDLSQPLPDLWPQFDCFGQIPLMVVRGEYSKLLTAETVAAMAKRHTNLRVLTAKGQGHAPILHLNGIASEIAEFFQAD